MSAERVIVPEPSRAFWMAKKLWLLWRIIESLTKAAAICSLVKFYRGTRSEDYPVLTPFKMQAPSTAEK